MCRLDKLRHQVAAEKWQATATSPLASSVLETKSNEININNNGFIIVDWLSMILPPYNKQNPLIGLIVMYFLVPTNCYIDRGFTQWFMIVSILYFLTRWNFLIKFQVLLGCSICAGWYSTLLYEYFKYGRFMDILYKNMPALMTDAMVVLKEQDDGSDGNVAWYASLNNNDGRYSIIQNAPLDYTSTKSLLIMIVSHVLDLLIHPYQTYLFWILFQSKRQKKKEQRED